MGKNKPSFIGFAIWTGLGGFVAAIIFSVFSEYVVRKFQLAAVSFAFLMVVIAIGIVFDMVGVATAVAAEHPFHAKATKRVKGAKHALYLIKNAHKVSVFCQDVIGDICGTVSGALGASIVFQFLTSHPTLNSTVFNIGMTGLVAAFTVGGKAAGKHTAMVDSEEIVFVVGRALGWTEEKTGISILPNGQRKGRDKN